MTKLLSMDLSRSSWSLAVPISLGLPALFWYNGGNPTLLAIAAIPLALVLAWSWPLGIALAFVSLGCFRLHDAFPALLPLRLPIMVGGLLVLSAWLQIFGQRIHVFFRREIVLMLLFTCHVTIGLIFAVDKQIAFDAWSGAFIKVILVAVLIAWVAKWPRDYRVLSFGITLSGAVIAGVAMHNWCYGINLIEGGRVAIGGVDSLIGDPNDLSFVLMFAVAFTLSMLLAPHEGAASRVLLAGALLLIVWAIIATKSRGGMIGVVAVLGVYVANRYKLNIKSLIGIGIFAAALVVLSGVMDRPYSSDSNAAVDDSSNGRLVAWGAGIKMAIARPIFGVGFENFVENYWAYTSEWTGKNRAAHSIWFAVLADTGFVGFAIYMAMIWHTVRSAFSVLKSVSTPAADPRLRTLALALVSGFTGTLAAGTFLSQAYSWPVFTQIGLIAALAHYVDGLKVPATLPHAASVMSSDDETAGRCSEASPPPACSDTVERNV